MVNNTLVLVSGSSKFMPLMLYDFNTDLVLAVSL